MFDRAAAQPSTRNQTVSKTRTFLAPSRGWIRSEALAKPKPGGAELMDNWFPTTEGCRMRGGSIKHATIDAAVTHLATYEAGAVSILFAADATSIYDVTNPADPDIAVTADVTGLTSGYWSSTLFTNSGGAFLMMVNGEDNLRRFDGSVWLTVTDVSSPAITGVPTNGLSHVWKGNSRLWFVQGGTMSAWYLGTNAVSGAATEFPLGGIFSLGGSLLFGVTFSMDTGEGLDDFTAFITDKGEVAVYQGTDPSSAATFAKVGVFKIGRPLGKNGWFRAGGDIGILTDDGIISMTQMLSKDRVGLQVSAITAPIEPEWRDAINERFTGVLPFSCVLWPAKSMLVVGVPATSGQSKYVFASNARTGAWARFTGWDVRCLGVYGDNMYFGTGSATIVRGDVSGADQGATYSAVVIPKFETLGMAEEKSAIHCRMVARANRDFAPQLFANSDYDIDIPTPLSADPDDASNVWGVGRWGIMTWGSISNIKIRQSDWQTVAANGHALAPGLQITSGRVTAPDVELISLVLVMELGEWAA